ncbi:hypothetical protein BACCIP111883_02674 [Sutcliffiella rhizosphaerae]|uniref:Histidine kinase N-terminal 7TM region domain-containing protein n=2 Tax=Sutcliffiella rhizosphaerae TaxID=2880967 RepID=A0ABN8A9Q3_9BACI|nr:hypothetical protein BACCIP111883_02674 [Sutcliffiella rhizosphaerae]
MDAVQLGPFLIKKTYLVLIFSSMLSFLYIAILLRKRTKLLHKVEEVLTSGLLIWLLTYKFSIIFFRPSILWTNPYGVLFLTGGTEGVYLATFVFIGFSFWRFNISNISLKTSIVILIPSLTITSFAYFGIMTLL